MNQTATSPGRRAGHAVTTPAGSAGSHALRAAGRQVLATAGNQVLKAAVDRAVSKVDQTAGRLDAYAAREPQPPSTRVAGTRPDRAASSAGRTPDSALRAKVIASYSFVVHRAMLLLQLIQRLARQLLDALASLVRRGRGSAAPEEGEEPMDTAPAPSTDKARRTGDTPRPSSKAAAGPQPTRRPRPTPGAPARRRVPGGQPSRTASDG
jgi:hypothetical protein